MTTLSHFLSDFLSLARETSLLTFCYSSHSDLEKLQSLEPANLHLSRNSTVDPKVGFLPASTISKPTVMNALWRTFELPYSRNYCCFRELLCLCSEAHPAQWKIVRSQDHIRLLAALAALQPHGITVEV